MRQHIQIVSSVIALATWSFFATSCDSSELEINEAVSPEILESLEDTALEFDVSYDALRAAMLEDGLLDAGLDIRTVAAELADQGEIALPPQSIPPPEPCNFGVYSIGASCRLASGKTKQEFVFNNGCWIPTTFHEVKWYHLDYYSNGQKRSALPFQSEWLLSPVSDPYCSTICHGADPW